MPGPTFRIHHNRVRGHKVATDRIENAEYLAYCVKDDNSFDFGYVAFGHGDTRYEAVEDLKRRLKWAVTG